jgi:hypothetical protein
MTYNPEAVNACIASSNRHGRKIGKHEATAIHRLLAGRNRFLDITMDEALASAKALARVLPHLKAEIVKRSDQAK